MICVLWCCNGDLQVRIPTNPNGESRVSGRLASEAA
jgi:hypothetical protein